METVRKIDRMMVWKMFLIEPKKKILKFS